MKLKEALKNLPFICEMTEKQVEAVKVLEKLGEKVLEIGGKMPENKYCTNDRADNCDSCPNGTGNTCIGASFQEAIDNCTIVVAGMLTEKDKKIAELERQLAGQKDQYRVLWDLCDRYELGAGGCPDSLLTEYIDGLQNKIVELERQLEWWGNLVKRECIGTKEIPSLKAYIEGLEQKIAELERKLSQEDDDCVSTCQEVQSLKKELAGKKQEVSVEEMKLEMSSSLGKSNLGLLSDDELECAAQAIHARIYGKEEK